MPIACLLVGALIFIQPVLGAPQRHEVFRWSGQVAGVERILIRGDQVQIVHVEAPALLYETYYLTSPLPAQRTKLKIRKLRGRGKVKLQQKPSAKNGFTAVVFIKDGNRGADDYEFELSWKSKPAPAPSLIDRAAPGVSIGVDSPRPRMTTETAPVNFVWPLQGEILSRFGAPRSHGHHQGIDIRGSRGEDVIAARSGRVVYSGGGLRGYGKTIILDHGKGLRTLYAHNSELLVRKGQKVRQGDVIARVGRSGRATTDHCHFEIRANRKTVDPLAYLPAR